MDFNQFDQQVKDDPAVSSFVQELACKIAPQGPTEKAERYVAGVDNVLIAVATYALFRWAKDYFDNKRAENETAVAERRARITKGLVSDGFAPEQAQAVTAGLLAQIAKRTDDDSVLQKALTLVGTAES